MNPFYLEIEMTKPVINYFKSKGYKVRKEIKIGFYYADLVAFKNNTVIAVELKLRNWKKAIIQAKNYQFGADYVYVVIPMMNVFNIIRKAQLKFEKEGIGLMVINEKTCIVSKIIKAKKSEKKIGKLSLNDIDNRLRNKKFKQSYFKP
jgi:hypothetical protein